MRIAGYVPRNSAFHRLDPRVKLLWFLVFTIIALAFRTLPVMGLMTLAITVVWIVAGVLNEALSFARRALPLFLIAFFTWIIFGAFNLDPQGHVLFGAGFFQVEDVDLIKALTTTLYIFTMISVFYVLILTTNFSELAQGLSQLKVPYSASFMISLIFQVIPILISEFTTIADAQRSRGLELDRGGLIERSKRYSAIAFPLILRCISLGRNMTTALYIYRFQPGSPRTTYREYKLRAGDLVFTLLMAGFTVLSVYAYINWRF